MRVLLSLVLCSCAATPIVPARPLVASPVVFEVSKPIVPPPAEESKPEALPEVVVEEAPWTWPLPTNHGVREDVVGVGWFAGYRGPTRSHNGLDFLAPLGTSLLAICAGQYRSGEREPYGKWVQLVCPIPEGLFGQAFVSILYAHLADSVEAPDYVAIERGFILGHVGKTGNAKGPKIKPHLHLEMVIHDDLVKARAEGHPLKDTGASEGLEGFLKERCLDLIGLRPTDGPLMYARRMDPYLLLTCLADQPPLDHPGKRWSEGYAASIDVDVERKAVFK